jgi:hypothetical protein
MQPQAACRLGCRSLACAERFGGEPEGADRRGVRNILARSKAQWAGLETLS